jgi:putative ABC transport system substrate-binding protein
MSYGGNRIDSARQFGVYVGRVLKGEKPARVQAVAVPVRATAEIEPALEAFARQPNGGLVLPTEGYSSARHTLIAEVAGRHRLPAISWNPEFPKDGGLMSYGVAINTLEQYRQAAGYVDRILKGAKPADLPVQRAVKYSLILNLNTVKELGLTVPLPLLGLADEVIE